MTEFQSHALSERSVLLTSGCSAKDFWCALKSDDQFAAELVNHIKATGFQAVRFETPSLSMESENAPFECVILKATLTDTSNKSAFSEHFTDEPAVSFQNLGKDSTLIVPTDKSSATNYAHLMSFLRTASDGQDIAVLKLWARSVLAELTSGNRVWANTAGAGVAWLHLRIDQRPKYYQYTKYKIR